MKDEYTIKEVAEMLEVSSSTVRRRIKEGQIEANKKKSRYGQTYYIPASEIDKAIMQEDVLEFKNSVTVSKQEIIKELVEAINSQNKNMIKEAMSNITQKIESQNEQIQEQNEAINKLSEKVNKLQEEQNKSLWERVKNYFL